MNKDMKEIIKAIESQGWTVSKRKNHYRCVSPKGDVVFLPSTPSEYRGIKNSKALLRRKGAQL